MESISTAQDSPSVIGYVNPNQSQRKTTTIPFWGTTYKTFYEKDQSHSRQPLPSNFLVSNFDIPTQSLYNYTRYKQRPQPTQRPLDYSKYDNFHQYVNSLNYQNDPNDIITRTPILKKTLDKAREGIINPEDGSIAKMMTKSNGFQLREQYY